MQSGGARLAPSSLGARLDKAQRDASSTAGGGTFVPTVLRGVPRNTDADALRKTTLLSV
tara:strand:- start:9123 stop:9299 length:177 start_codon:yes stop_codon:yes gene_type:complete